MPAYIPVPSPAPRGMSQVLSYNPRSQKAPLSDTEEHKLLLVKSLFSFPSSSQLSLNKRHERDQPVILAALGHLNNDHRIMSVESP